MDTLFFRESPTLLLYITILFGILENTIRYYYNNTKYSYLLFTLYIITIASLMYFYRIPDRTNNYPPEFVVAPSDGVVKSIIKLNHHTTHIAIYLNLLDTHIQWSPLQGTIVKLTHKTGRFHPAYLLEKSKYNERVETTIYNPVIDDHIKVVQIAGQLARRITTYVTPHQHIHRGQLLGMIKLSSRVDLFIPHKKINIFI